MKRDAQEIDKGGGYIGYREACDIIEAHIHPIKGESLGLYECAGRIAAADLAARISFPSIDVSLKDGYAVQSEDMAFASVHNPSILKLSGSAFAGKGFDRQVESGFAVGVCSGATIPSGADAVVAGEFCKAVSSGDVYVQADAGPGRNILPAGVEIKAGEILVRKGQYLSPGLLGLAAAAGIDQIRVYRKPRVAIISIGDEVVAPGEALQAGQLYASNLATMAAWLFSLGMPCATSVIADSEDAICRELEKQLPDAGFCALSAMSSPQGKEGCFYPVEEAPDIVQAPCVAKNSKNKVNAELFAAYLLCEDAAKIRKKYGYR